MKEIALTQGKVALVDDEDYHSLSQHSWSALARNDGPTYAIRTVYNPKRTVYMHVELNGPGTDHRDGNGLNNQRHNLRSANAHQNARNAGKRKTQTSSTYKGVCKRPDTNKYRAYIRLEGTLVHLGTFADEIEAAKRYDKAALEYFGEFARLNFPEINA